MFHVDGQLNSQVWDRLGYRKAEGTQIEGLVGGNIVANGWHNRMKKELEEQGLRPVSVPFWVMETKEGIPYALSYCNNLQVDGFDFPSTWHDDAGLRCLVNVTWRE